MASERLLQHIDDVTGLQRDGDLRGQRLAAGPIYDGGQGYKPFGHRNIRRIQCPHLVGLVDGKSAQQVGINFMAGVFLAGARFSTQRLHAHARHQRATCVRPI